MLSSVLIANRGEIARRIIRTAKRLGIRTVAVYSEADADALHVREADEAHLIGPAPARESYLDITRVMEAAKRSRVQSIHPGYGFLSENPEFAAACLERGIVFIGPPVEAIRAMGHKDAAKALMAKAGVPVVPGYQGKSQDERTLAKAAREIGYPVMIKAVAGGGGKGMRQVTSPSEFAEALMSCRREAMASFGDERVLIEKFIANPRHVEVQIIADTHGQCLHLYERDCSVQRRHQKVIEEAPAPKLADGLRDKICAAAVMAGKATGYANAGTVEFIAATDPYGQVSDFYFMEMNTRLQVEHPVTEMIVGLDLVELQFRIASGERLALSQADVPSSGHAIEARLYAENPSAGFLPQSGIVHGLRWPKDHPDIRIDTGIEEGSVITPFYDPMIAKLIARGDTREAAIARMNAALGETSILGLSSNLGFLRRILQHPHFADGGVTTAFIDTHLADLVGSPPTQGERAAAAAAWADHPRSARRQGAGWNDEGGWALAGLPRKDIVPLLVNGEPVTLEVSYRPSRLDILVRGKDGPIPVEAAPEAQHFDEEHQILYVAVNGKHCTVRGEDVLARIAGQGEGAAVVHAPMPGKVIAVLVAEGQAVEAGRPVVILEAMKMEHTLKAAVAGNIRRLPVKAGSQVKEGDVLFVIEDTPATP